MKSKIISILPFIGSIILSLATTGCGETVNPGNGDRFCLGGPCADGGTSGSAGTAGSGAQAANGGTGGSGGEAGNGGSAATGATGGTGGTGATGGTGGTGATGGTGGTGATGGTGGTAGSGGTGGCPPGETDCGGNCVNTDTDVNNCGTCGYDCETQFAQGSVCDNGNCSCVALGLLNCDGVCVDTDVDPNNCGGCGNVCSPSQVCTGGACVSQQACVEGQIIQCGLSEGECIPGTMTCTGGSWGTCDNYTGPVAETCDGLDNDCNGAVDDGVLCACALGATQSCGSDVGECVAGLQTCVAYQSGTTWGDCVGSVGPSQEVFNGLDDNCDGLVDEGLQCLDGSVTTCGSNVGMCSYGTRDCINGVWTACAGSVGPTAEVCDSLDNDCNGSADDGIVCQCVVGSTRPCGSAVGECSQGLQTCELQGQNTVWGACIGAVGPVGETCNSLDDDCNGLVDDGVGCQCVPDSTRTCGSNTGVCSFGVQTCDLNGVWGVVCAGEVGPSAETCDGLDNDCNGVIDEGAGCQCQPGSMRVCGNGIGECETGIQTCNVNGVWDPVCAGSVGPSPEVCDYLDNDCNGVPDDTGNCQCNQGEQRPCGSTIGECSQGLQDCISDGNGGFIWSPNCVGAIGPVPEVCDGYDNDCNGVNDDAVICSCLPGSTQACGSNEGQCAGGTQTCQPNGTWGTCNGAVWPVDEVCNNLDDDCDGDTDEDIICACQPGSVRTCGTAMGECETGTQVCQNDFTWGACSGAVNPVAEICDGYDNDCNGSVDDGIVCQCVVGSTRTCGLALGVCQLGEQECLEDTVTHLTYWDSACIGAVGPIAETCNGLDDDCNGAPDDGIICQCVVGAQRLCGSAVGECEPGTQTCVQVGPNTQWGTCVGGVLPTDEVCNALDDDCNGVPDDGPLCQCTNGEQRPCGSNVGECSYGLQDCVSDGQGGFYWDTICNGAVNPSPEICDGLDNDCNGAVDDAACQCDPGDQRVCGLATGECQQGIQTCLNSGVWGPNCVGAVGPAAETCDGLDNDCNGVADDGIGCVCTPGETRVCGSNNGECEQGVQTCLPSGLGWGACLGGVNPSTEVCDGLDNDCNGLIDEGVLCECLPGEQQPCGSNVGQCQMGLQDCVSDGVGGFVWGGICVGEVGPATETCNNLDDDCNGVADDSIGCQCITGSTRTCGSNVGECSYGIQTCVNGIWASTCAGEVGPSAELCDGLDNDCNGSPDDGLLCQCVQGATRPCGSSVGQCSQGTQTCLLDPNTNQTYWSAVCAGSVNPVPEVCNGLDDDCNGTPDEGCQCNPGSTRVCGSAVGQCSYGSQLCLANGTWSPVCAGAVLPSPELCDGVDNDCNGSSDETCSCLNGSVQPCGSNIGTCSLGTQTCVNGVWAACVGYVGPSSDGPPACDGLDNDCNGIVDDTCSCMNGSTQPCGISTGECAQGVSTCTGGVWGVCVGYIGPQPEVCGDGLDQNCNGVSDDPALCTTLCTPNTACYTGYCGICANGICNASGDTCVPAAAGNESSACSDGLDNDCDCLTDAADPDCSLGGTFTTLYTGTPYEQLVIPNVSTNNPLPGSTGNGACETINTSFNPAANNCLIAWFNNGGNTFDSFTTNPPSSVQATCGTFLNCPTNSFLWQENVSFIANGSVNQSVNGNFITWTHPVSCGRHVWRLCW